jgi:hypothetical protein
LTLYSSGSVRLGKRYHLRLEELRMFDRLEELRMFDPARLSPTRDNFLCSLRVSLQNRRTKSRIAQMLRESTLGRSVKLLSTSERG